MTYRIKIKELATAYYVSNSIICAAFILAAVTCQIQAFESSLYIATLPGEIAPMAILLGVKFASYTCLSLMLWFAAYHFLPKWKKWKK